VYSRAKSHSEERSFLRKSHPRRERSNRVLFPKLDATPDFVQPVRYHSRLSVNDPSCIQVAFPLYRVVRSVGLFSDGRSIYSRTHGVTQKCRLFRARCFEVARNSHPRNVNYVRPYEQICTRGIPNNASPCASRRWKWTLAQHRLYLHAILLLRL